MNQFLIAAALAVASVSAQAAVHLTTSSPLATAVLGSNEDDAVYQGSTVEVANLFVSGPAKVTYTFEFKEAAFNNRFFSGNTAVFSNAGTAPGASFSAVAATGVLDFGFGINSTVKSVLNGSNTADEPNFGILRKSSTDAVLFLNDTGAHKDGDWDDMIVRVHVDAVPEPSSWHMMLAGLGAAVLLMARKSRASI